MVIIPNDRQKIFRAANDKINMGKLSIERQPSNKKVVKKRNIRIIKLMYASTKHRVMTVSIGFTCLYVKRDLLAFREFKEDIIDPWNVLQYINPIPRKIYIFSPFVGLMRKKENIAINIPKVTNGSIKTPKNPNLALLIFVFNSLYIKAFITFFWICQPEKTLFKQLYIILLFN